MNQFWHIAKYKVISFFVVSFDRKAKTLFKNIATMLVYTAFALGMYKITYSTLEYVFGTIHLNVFLFHRFISMALFIFFLSVIAGNLLVSFTGLFKSKEIDYLLTKPVAYETIYIVKFFDNFFYSSSTLLMILFAVLYAYGSYFHLGVWFYVYSLLGLFLPFSLIAAMLGALQLFALLKIVKWIGVRITILIIIAFYIIVTITFFVGNDPPDIIKSMFASEAFARVYFQQFDSILLKLLPNYWVSNSMYYFLRGNSVMVLQYMILLFCTCAVLLIIIYLIARKTFYNGYLFAATIRFRKEKNSEEGEQMIINFRRQWERFPVFSALIKKEAALFLRDISQVLQFAVMLVLVAMFVQSVSGRPHSIFISLLPPLQTVIYLVFIIFNAFMISSLALRFVFPHQSLEGEPFWKLASAPVNFRKVLAVKFSISFVVLLILAEGLNAFSHRRFSETLFMFSSILTFFITLTVCAINFAFGILFVNYREKNPIRIASSPGASTAFLLCLFYLAFLIGDLSPSLLVYFQRTQNLKLAVSFSHFVLPLAVMIIISVFITGVSYVLAARQLKKDFAVM